ncbi:MAG TPA: bifunctional riboflavin kinase/FAD synthetase [Stellaceae bacterium]|jgi:riboflavin kinase/FMN adenylyltransferase|nr:bifunctional riboflavin kinase/FAD synthetase [Stellaceae bacterium]
MRVFRHTGATGDARGAVVAAGNFDGVHLGHQAVLAETKALARAAGAPFAVLTFEPHPRAVFQPGLPPFRLTPFRAKSLVLEALGVDLLFTLHFDLAFAQKSAEEFVAETLVAGLGAKTVVVGYDFVFGHKRRGTPELLKAEGLKHGFGVHIVAPVAGAGGAVYSSTQIREHLVAGRPREAAALLGRPWEIDGRVDVGDKLGRTIGFPTANIALADYLRPAPGVYAVRAGIEDGANMDWHDGAANLGWRPTVGGKDLRLETHLFDFSGDLYGKHLRVALIERLRAEQRFDGLDALKAQIAIDCQNARQILGGG